MFIESNRKSSNRRKSAELYLGNFKTCKISEAVWWRHQIQSKVLAKDFRKTNWMHGSAGYVFIWKSKRKNMKEEGRRNTCSDHKVQKKKDAYIALWHFPPILLKEFGSSIPRTIPIQKEKRFTTIFFRRWIILFQSRCHRRRHRKSARTTRSCIYWYSLHSNWFTAGSWS